MFEINKHTWLRFRIYNVTILLVAKLTVSYVLEMIRFISLRIHLAYHRLYNAASILLTAMIVDAFEFWHVICALHILLSVTK